MFRIVVLNLGFLLVTCILVFLPVTANKIMERIGAESFLLEIILTGIGILLCSIYLATAAYTVRPISDYATFGFGDFFANIKHAYIAGLVMGFCIFFLFIVITVILPFYLAIESIFGLVLAAVVVWVTIFGLVSFQFYYSVHARLGGKIGKSFKKCMLIALDNTGFAIFIFIHNLIVILLPLQFPFLLFLILLPGPAGILLYIDQALRLRLLKYDWLEANPGANRKKIPWDALLIEEREKVGVRSFRNFIFPWKD